MFKKATWPYTMAKDCIVFSNLNESLFYLKICLFNHLLYFDYAFSNIRFKPANVLSCHEMNEQNELSDDEFDDYEEVSEQPKYVAKEFWQFEY